ncbi:MAG: hypothetical protein JW760_13420 [Spirochaetales bacterium]|nr:hypothetical protein [Spirochaetales bacterium]
MVIEKVEPKDKKAARRFIRLPFSILGKEKNWVPPMERELFTLLSRRHPFFSHSEAAFFLASRDGEDTGRIAVLDHRPYNRHHGEQTAFFTCFDLRQDEETAEALLDAATLWARNRGLKRLLGPKGFLRSSGQGLLVEGFDYFPALGIPWNPPYYRDLLEKAGCSKVTDLLSGYIDYGRRGDERLYRAAEIVRRRGAFGILAFRRRRDCKPWLPAFKELQHLAFADNPNYIPSTDREFDLMARNMMLLADLSITRFITKKEDLSGFILAFPNIGRALQRCRGKLFPSGWLQILSERKKTRALDLNALGILPRYQKQGGEALLFTELERLIRSSRYTSAEVLQIDEKNTLSRAAIEYFGVRWCKRHRIYERFLGGRE